MQRTLSRSVCPSAFACLASCMQAGTHHPPCMRAPVSHRHALCNTCMQHVIACAASRATLPCMHACSTSTGQRQQHKRPQRMAGRPCARLQRHPHPAIRAALLLGAALQLRCGCLAPGLGQRVLTAPLFLRRSSDHHDRHCVAWPAPMGHAWTAVGCMHAASAQTSFAWLRQHC